MHLIISLRLGTLPTQYTRRPAVSGDCLRMPTVNAYCLRSVQPLVRKDTPLYARPASAATDKELMYAHAGCVLCFIVCLGALPGQSSRRLCCALSCPAAHAGCSAYVLVPDTPCVPGTFSSCRALPLAVLYRVRTAPPSMHSDTLAVLSVSCLQASLSFLREKHKLIPVLVGPCKHL